LRLSRHSLFELISRNDERNSFLLAAAEIARLMRLLKIGLSLTELRQRQAYQLLNVLLRNMRLFSFVREREIVNPNLSRAAKRVDS